jgi:hypothetical protein
MGAFFHGPGPTAARVDFVTPDNATFIDAVQFDPRGPTGSTGGAWGLTGQSFRMDIKRRRDDTNALLSLTSPNEIVTDDTTLRIIHFNVSETVLTAALIPGRYVYDFIMFDSSSPPVRVQLMYGEFKLTHGVTGG